MEIFQKSVELYTLDYKRSWRTLFIRRPVRKKVFVGYINTIHKNYDGVVMELVDENHRTRQGYYMEKKNVDLPYLRPWLYELNEVK